ncbi:MAG: Ldh family oxidoreductase [Proteobacteria bacterium]|nr:Ldh family oxidoreductase [Pseudomonadota bacterium]MBU2260386.1 Ldh family oxidoreductase [Pseudomonadota bacterium]
MVKEASAGPKVMARHDQLETFCIRVLEKLRVPREEAEITAKTLVTANLRGVDTHGVLRLPLYAAKLKGGALQPSVNLTTERETIATALLDGHDGIGQVISCRAMQMAIRKAGETGVSYVAVKNSNHFGAAAYYSMMAPEHDMIGLAFTNASPRLAPTGGVERLFGNNPWSIAVPAGKRPPIVLDMANSVVAAGKIRILQKEGKPIPEGWALNEYGEPTTDAAEALRGILLAVGGYKGYGITLMMDLLTGVLADSNYGPRVKGMDQDAAPGGVAHSFMAISLAAFTDVAAFKARMESYVDEIKSSKKARGAEVIYVPGEPEHLRVQERLAKGIPLQAKVAEELRAIGKELGIPIDL